MKNSIQTRDLKTGDRIARISGEVWTPSVCHERAVVDIGRNGRIAEVVPVENGLPEKAMPGVAECKIAGAPPPHSLESGLSLEAGADFIVAPGLLDTHMHGAGGGDILFGEPAQVEMVRRAGARGGAAGLVVIVPYYREDSDLRRFRAAVEALRAASACPGSRILGINLETPFLNPVRRGGFPESCCHPVDLGLFDRLCEAAEGQVRLMTLSPEIDGAERLTREALARGIRVSLGHSTAGAELARRAFDWGPNRLTHTFNAMNSLHHRDVGLLGAAILDERIYLEVIPDGIHVNADALRLLTRLAPPRRLIGITDGNAGAGMPEGTPLRAVGGSASVRDGAVRLEDGTLAGSTLLADGAMRGLMTMGGLPPRAALECLTLSPARSLGIEAEHGVIAPGAHADFTLLDRRTFQPAATIIGGKVVWRRG